MKNWKGKAVAVTLLVFVLYVLFNHMNLNPLYPEAAFAYCVLFTVLFAIFTLDKIGRFAVSQAANGAPHVAFVRHPKFRRWPIVVVAVLWGRVFCREHRLFRAFSGEGIPGADAGAAGDGLCRGL